MKLSKEQFNAVKAPLNKTSVVLASPGSGKTLVIVERVRWMISKKVDPSKIVVITFGNKAAEEVKSRLCNRKVHVSTIHSFCFGIVKCEDHRLELTPSYVIRSQIESRMSSLGMDLAEFSTVERWIEFSKIVGIASTREEVASWVVKQGLEINLADKIAQCAESTRSSFAFSDMPLRAYRILKSKKTLLDTMRKRYKYCLVDEGQDTFKLAVEFIRLLFGEKIFIVGDPDQTLYRFAGSTPDTNLFELAKKAKVFTLKSNYRSGETIIEAASNLIAQNYEKEYGNFKRAMNAEVKENSQIIVQRVQDETAEAGRVAHNINERQTSLILARTNAQLPFTALELSKENIEYAYLGDGGFFKLSHIHAIISYLRLLVNKDDDDAFKTVVNVSSTTMTTRDGTYSPTRFLGSSFLTECSRYKSLWQGMRHVKDWKYKSGIDDFEILMDVLDAFDSTDVEGIVSAIATKSVLPCFSARSSNNVLDDRLEEDIQSLLTLARKSKSIEKFLSKVDALERKERQRNDNCNILLATVHKAKGREADIVFLLGFVEGLLPHKYSISPETKAGLKDPVVTDIVDERRIAFVAITRAKSQLHIMVPETFNGLSMAPSRFLKEMKL